MSSRFLKVFKLIHTFQERKKEIPMTITIHELLRNFIYKGAQNLTVNIVNIFCI
jgi:hypothetical protein